MPEEHLSPEEKLLRLIRGEKKPKDKPVASADAAAAEPRDKAEAGRPFQKAAHRAERKDERDHLKFINTALVIILALITAVLMADTIIFNMKKGSSIHTSARRPAALNVKDIQKASGEEDLPGEPEEGGGTIETRDLFKPQAQAPVSGGRITEDTLDRLKDFSLKGIIAGDNPQAIIEDTKNQKSYFLNKGQSLNQMSVEDIQENKVIFKVNGELLELTL